MKSLIFIALLLSSIAYASVTIPYVFSPSTTIQSSKVNANFSAVASEINSHEAALNPHQTRLQDILQLNNSCGTYAINFNGNQALDMEVENVTADPTPGSSGRLIWNYSTGLFKIDNGSSWVSVGGAGVNNLTSVLNSGNSAGSFNIDLNENQLLHGRVENLSSDPSSGNTGRLFINTTSHALKLDTGSSITAVGGSQGLASVLGVSNSAGSTNIDFNSNQAKNMILDSLSSDPGSPTAGQIWYNTTSKITKFYNGTSSLAVGNTNTLAQTLVLGNSVGSNPINFNNQQAQSMVLFNNNGSPGTGTGGFVWYDTGNSQIGYETSGVNHYLADRDSTQTLTNKTISGASNTLTNIGDGSLSANVVLLNSSQAITGVKTFTAYPIVDSIKSTSGARIQFPSGSPDDTVCYLNTTQTMSGKTLVGPAFTSNTDFTEGQAVHFRVENLSSDPVAGNAGRVYYKSTTGELKYDDGTNTRVLQSATSSVPTLSAVLSAGNSAGASNVDMNENQLLNAKIQNVSGLPAAGNPGRIVFNTANNIFYLDNGTFWVATGATTFSSKVVTPIVSTILAIDQVFVVANCGSNCTMTLPSISSITTSGGGSTFTYPFYVKNISTKVITVTGTGGDTIDGNASVDMNFQYESLTFLPSPSGWLIL